MSDSLDIVIEKNRLIGRLKLINAGLIVVIIMALILILFLGLISRLQPPSPTPSIKVLERHLYEGKYGLKVPSVITVGELFSYQTEGKKLVDNNPDVRLQIVCRTNGTQSIQTIATFTSVGVKKGDFKINRSTTVTPSTKNVASDDCEMQSLSTYTFYTADKNGTESSFQTTETAISNKFKLIVPKDEEMTPNVQNTPVNSGVQTGTTSTSSQTPNVAQSTNNGQPAQVTNNSTTTTNNTSNTTNNTAPPQSGGLVRNVFDGLFDGLGL